MSWSPDKIGVTLLISCIVPLTTNDTRKKKESATISDFIIPETTISSISPHNGADNLEIAQILGWQTIVAKGKYEAGSPVLFFAPDTVIPRELADEWDITNYLSKGRVKSIRLKGEASHGLVMPIPEDKPADQSATEYYAAKGVHKWEPPVRNAGRFTQPHDHPVRVNNPYFPSFTHIQNLRHFPNLFEPDELVVCTEKIHGTNSRVGLINGEEWVAGSHRVQRGEGDELYWYPLTLPSVKNLLTSLGKRHKQVVLYGEIFGEGIQTYTYGMVRDYRAFDLYVDGRYLDWETFTAYCYHYCVPTVPKLTSYLPITFGELTMSDVVGTYDNKSIIGGDHCSEGLVVRPLLERSHPKVGRLVLKYLSDDYLLDRKRSDFTEE